MRRKVSFSMPLVALRKSISGRSHWAMCSKLRRQWCEGITLTTISAPSSASLKSPVALTDAGRVHPGRNISLTLDFAIDLTTSFSSAHSRTSWLPRRPATMARAVPHAPPPMTAIRLMSYSCNIAGTPGFTIRESSSASQFVRRMHPCDSVCPIKCGAGVPWMP